MQASEQVDANNLGVAGRPLLPIEETARLGTEIYERDIKAQVEADHVGEVVAIDVESGAWAMGANMIEASGRLQSQRPDANDIWLERVGRRGLYKFAGGSWRSPK